MAIIKDIRQTYTLTIPPRKWELDVFYFSNIIRYLSSVYQGTVENYTASKSAAITFFKDLVEKMFARNVEPNTLDNYIKYPGYFYLIGYESKLYKEFTKGRGGTEPKRKLGYYDAMPLIFVIDVDSTGFLACNFHWTHPKGRAILLRSIALRYPEKFMNDEIIRPMSWSLFKSAIGIYRKKFFKYAIRRYSWAQMRNVKGFKIVRIPNTDMINAINYTSALWIGITEVEVRKKYFKLEPNPKTKKWKNGPTKRS